MKIAAQSRLKYTRMHINTKLAEHKLSGLRQFVQLSSKTNTMPTQAE